MAQIYNIHAKFDRYGSKPKRNSIAYFHEKLQVIADLTDDLADEIEAHIMKKTTQRSPEFFGGANC